MTQTITRMYDGVERANAVAHELRNNRVMTFDDVHVVAGGSDTGADGLVDAMMRVLVLRAHARVFAERIRRGGALVVVHAPFGSAGEALNILERHNPIDSGVPDDRDAPLLWDEAAPLSSALHLRVLLPDADSFSKFWSLRPLAKSGATTSAALGLPEIKPSRGPYNATIGLPLLSSKATPLSSMLGLPLLRASRAGR